MIQGACDAPGNIKSEPDGCKDDEQGDNEQQDQQPELEGIFKKFQLAIVVDSLADRGHLLESLVVNEQGGDEDRTCGLVFEQDRAEAADQITTLEFLNNGPGLLVGTDLIEKIAGDAGQFFRSQGWGRHRDGSVVVAQNQGQAVWVDPPVHPHEFFQGLADALGVDRGRCVLGQSSTQVPVQVRGLLALVIQDRLRQFQGTLQGTLDVRVEPVVHGGGDKLQSDKKEQAGWDQREADERDDQLGLEFGTQNLAAAVKEEFGQAAQDQEEHEQDQDDVQIDQSEDQDVAADRQAQVGLEQ